MLFKDCICFQLGKTVRQVSKAYRKEITSYKLTHGQFFMMVAIMEEEGLLPSELADKTSQDRATTTGLLDRLEKDRWVERRSDKNDRRSLRIFLTPQARNKREEILKLFQKTNQKFLNCFTQEEWDQMQNFFNRLDQCNESELVS
ncbi:MAG: MarR family transcriptional regulator [Deltaproteobacteria bacterium]|uniref:MarR family winged helix-turn-helix transcriptional regulator n=1 Tax=Desulfobacula sp. TaxID=2593537 RepID=UPI0019B1528B|nr:MarR family transcriptional regulator [Candidatus Desulfobacula maris]MBL6994226.1 MarR family transcriptional regulator [Desulfobacula sp.]